MRISATVRIETGSRAIERSVEVTRVFADKLYPTTQKLLKLCAAPERAPRSRAIKRSRKGGRR